MKKSLYIICSSLSIFYISNSFAETTSNKSGFYITGKVGASVLQQKNQKYLQRYKHYIWDDNLEDAVWSNYSNYYGKSGGTHSNARLGGGIAIGYNFDTHFHAPIRVELDVMARMGDNNNYLRDRQTLHYHWLPGPTNYENTINNKVQLNTFMFNGFYDFKNKSPFTPYLMAGVGLASFKHTSMPSVSYTDYNEANEITGYYKNGIKKAHTANNFAWNAGVGVRYAINTDFSLDFSYRYLGAGKSSFETYRLYNGYERSKIRVVTQDIMLGLTYNF